MICRVSREYIILYKVHRECAFYHHICNMYSHTHTNTPMPWPTVCKWLLSVGFVIQGSLWIQHIYSGSLARVTQFPFQAFVYTQRGIYCCVVAKDSSSGCYMYGRYVRTTVICFRNVRVSFTAAYTTNTLCSRMCMCCELRHVFFFCFFRWVNDHTETTSNLKWNELYIYMLAMLKMHLNTLIHSGNSCHLLGVKLFTLVSFVRSFCYSLSFSFFLSYSNTLYVYILKLSKLASVLNTLRWKLFVSWCTEFSVLFPNNIHACIVSCW